MNKTDIEYLDYTWNPISMRCTPKSTGCLNCWHLMVADRLANNPKMPEEKRHAWSGGRYILDEKKLKDPFKKKEPSTIGVQFMGDLGHWNITFEDFCKIMQEIERSRRHTFILLTKRPNRIKQFVDTFTSNMTMNEEPLPNLWIGVSCSTQKDTDDNIPVLMEIPAAKHIVSFEPMLSMINLEDYKGIDWAICGCESGSKRRPTELQWIQGLCAQCFVLDIPFFLKQMEISGKVVSMPKLDGKTRAEYPE